jgi:hypothetical protein
MGINVDNLFTRFSDQEALLNHLSVLLRRKLAVSTAQGGWIQAIVAGEVSPPDVAQQLSVDLQVEVACVQLYEGSGDAGWALNKNGYEADRFHSDSLDDPAGAVAEWLSKRGIPHPVRQFRELVLMKGEGARTRAPTA